MGLDTTLPTQPWDAVKATGAPISATASSTALSAEDFDKILSENLLFYDKAQFIQDWIMLEVVVKDNGYKQGMPARSYAIMADSEARLKQLAGIAGPDEIREKWRLWLIEDIKKTMLRLALTERGVKTAQANGGWTLSAREFTKEANALLLTEPTVKLSKEEREALAASKPFLYSLPVDLQCKLDLIEDNARFPLGILSSSQKPTFVVSVKKHSLADKLGIEEGDHLVSSDGNQFDSLHDFKMFLVNNAGKTMKVRIERDDQVHYVEMKIPNSLPDY